MEAKDKAIELVEKFENTDYALICVDKILEALEINSKQNIVTLKYYEQVKEEISNQIKIIETPEDISNLLIKLSGVNIYEKTRRNEIVEHRALLCYMLRNKLNMRWVSIANFIKSQGMESYDHATAINANKKYLLYKNDRFTYFDKLESNFIIKTQIKYSQISKLEVIQKDYNKLEKNYTNTKKELNTIKETTEQTTNEIQYRTLTEEQKEKYDERVKVILKSFEWKQDNSNYEIINCAS